MMNHRTNRCMYVPFSGQSEDFGEQIVAYAIFRPMLRYYHKHHNRLADRVLMGRFFPAPTLMDNFPRNNARTSRMVANPLLLIAIFLRVETVNPSMIYTSCFWCTFFTILVIPLVKALG